MKSRKKRMAGYLLVELHFLLKCHLPGQGFGVLAPLPLVRPVALFREARVPVLIAGARHLMTLLVRFSLAGLEALGLSIHQQILLHLQLPVLEAAILARVPHPCVPGLAPSPLTERALVKVE